MLSQQDLELIHHEVSRFTREQLAPQVARPEESLSSGQFEALRQDFAKLGLEGEDDAEETGLWLQPEDPAAVQLSLETLTTLGQSNPGFALHIHRQALAFWLSRKLGWALNPIANCQLALQGHYGLGRYALAHYLKPEARGQTPQPELIAQLTDYFTPTSQQPIPFLGKAGWTTLILPTVTGEGVLQWQAFDRQTLQLNTHPDAHGLNELTLHTLASSGPNARHSAPLTLSESRALWQQLLQMEWLGLAAISLGTLRHGLTLAKDYAALRRQGGQLIHHHPAVQHLLMDADHAAQNGAQLLHLAATRGINADSMGATLALRMQTQTSFCTAANQCLQVLGGSGYMRDTGPEKVVRDLNVLKLQSGSPTELRLFAFAWNSPQ